MDRPGDPTAAQPAGPADDPVAVLRAAGHLSWLLANGDGAEPDPFTWPPRRPDTGR